MTDLLVTIGINFISLFLIFLFFRWRLNKVVKTTFVIDQIRTEVDGMIIELNNTTNRNITLIEEKLGEMTKLAERADKSILLLSKTLENKKVGGDLYTSIRPKVRVLPESYGEPSGKELTAKDRVERMHREGMSKEEIAGKSGKTLSEIELILSLAQRKEEEWNRF